MARRWWGGPGISVILHAALLVVLVFAAVQPSQLAATAAIAARPMKFIYTAAPGREGSGGGQPTAAAPRAAHLPESAPVTVAAPRSMPNVDQPVAAVPAIATQDVDVLPGAPMALDGSTPGRGSGPGRGGGHGPGMGPGDGPGAGDVYAAGVGGVSNPALIHEVRPNYTGDAMRAKIQGVVIMDVVVLENGLVDPDRMRITRSLDPGLDKEAIIAVRQWRFRPSTLLGQPVASRVTVELAFTLR
jgi:TonB family protein